MPRKVFIIHQSEIIRKGLLSVIRSHFNCDITLLGKVENLQQAEVTGFTEGIVFIDEEEYQTNVFTNWHFALKQSEVFLIRSGMVTVKDFSLDHVITLNHSSEEILAMLKACDSGRQLENDNVSEELSQREKEVLKEVALGLSNKEIADKLFISIHTVISHRKNITEKLGVKSISGLTVYAVMNNLLDTSMINPGDLI